MRYVKKVPVHAMSDVHPPEQSTPVPFVFITKINIVVNLMSFYLIMISTIKFQFDSILIISNAALGSCSSVWLGVGR